MDHSLPHDNPTPAGVKRWQLWFSLFAGTFVWVLHLLTVYPLTSLTCEWDWFPSEIAGLHGLRFIQILITLVALAIVLQAGYFAFNIQRHLTPQNSRHLFMARLGLALNIIFAGLIAFAVVPILALPVCG
ncbi:MAG: hypothetical protein RLP44_18460 [Aggregatilineales bacterium]